MSDRLRALALPFDHELALLVDGQKRIVKMEFSDSRRVAGACEMGFVGSDVLQRYRIGDQNADIIYGVGQERTTFVGRTKDVERAMELERLEQGSDTTRRSKAMREFGELLGYPSCCVEAYESQATQDESASFERVLGGRAEAKGLYGNNLFVLGHQLISHFPCSLSCTKSAELADRALGLCRRVDPALAQMTETLLMSPIRVWDRFRFLIEHPQWGALDATHLSVLPRVRNHRGLRDFLARLPLLPGEGTRIIWHH
jgi:hypothetical protein